MHTDKTLKGMTKAQLLEIATANGIEINESMKNEDIKALILAKECPVTSEDSLNKTEPRVGVPSFTKDQILNSRWFSHRRDILTVLLSDDKEYSHGEVDALLVEFMKGKVN